MEALLKLGALELARNIARKKITPLEAVDAHIARIEEVNPKINAMVADRFERARAEAVAAGEELAAGRKELPPLFGVPCSIKETFALTGMPQTAGSVLRRDHISEDDATAVKRLRAAGAIPLGVTNVPEMAMWSETYNKVYGRTKNPFGLDRTAGGSSGGEAAIVGAGGAPFGLGSDIGGSIRMPAFFCGVFGHKPTGGAVPMTGHYPRGSGAVGRYNVAGPICRRAKDLMPLMRILAGPDGLDPAVIDLEFGDEAAVDFQGRRVLYLHDMHAHFSVGPDQPTRTAVDRAVMALTSKGGDAIEWSSPRLREAMAIWGTMIGQGDGPSFGELLGQGRTPNYALEMVLLSMGLSKHTLPALLFGMTENLFGRLTQKNARDMIQLGVELRAELEAALGDDAVLVMPTHPRTAPRHDTPLTRPFDFVYTGIINVLELPATTIPMGLGPGMVPLGVQVVAGHGKDHLSIAAALFLEGVVGGWSMPIRSLM